MKILFLYNSTQTYTNTVFEHISCFPKYSHHRCYFVHQDQNSKVSVDYSVFDAVVIHYSVRLPYDQISHENAASLRGYKGLKALFIQDEYDHTHRTWEWINRLGVQLIFTVVPEKSVANVYPPERFPNVRFVNVLTGYVPEGLPAGGGQPPSKRELMVGYRGRPLPIRYGALGIDKVSIGKMVKRYCEGRGISHDIAWSEEERIYGPKWYEFLSSCRATLGSESGSNVFDWEGNLNLTIDKFRHKNPTATDDDIYKAVVSLCEAPGMMNQISPRVFEAIALRTILVLFEGRYSDIVQPYLHYLPLKKDGSNLAEVFSLLANEDYVDKIAERAYQDIIASGKYSYQSFVKLVDAEFENGVIAVRDGQLNYEQQTKMITSSPIRSEPPTKSIANIANQGNTVILQAAYHLWMMFPKPIRAILKPFMKIIARPLIGKYYNL